VVRTDGLKTVPFNSLKWLREKPRKVGGGRNDWRGGITIAVLAKKSIGFLARPAWVFSGGRAQAELIRQIWACLDSGDLAPIVFSAK
jgi:hypothetical protein